MARGNGFRGSSVGADPGVESERSVLAERIMAAVRCAEGHPTGILSEAPAGLRAAA